MIKNYILTAFKIFQRRKFFTFASLFAISFTLVVLMVTVSLLENMFGPMPPESRANRILGVFKIQLRDNKGTRDYEGPPDIKIIDQYVRGMPGVEKVAVLDSGDSTKVVLQSGEKIKLRVKRTDAVFWEIMDFTFIEGHPYTEDDCKKNNFVAVINETIRNKIFGKRPALGKWIDIDSEKFRVVGVVKDVSSFRQIPFSEIWRPIVTQKQLAPPGYALLLAGSASDIPAIKAEFQSRLKERELPNPGVISFFNSENIHWKHITSRAETFFEMKTEGLRSGSLYSRLQGFFNMKGFAHISFNENPSDKPDIENYRPGSWVTILITTMFLFMLLPTINLANMNISRIMERGSEIGVRKAFGASSWILVGQFVTENVILTLVGGLLGFIFTLSVLHAITLSGWVPYGDFRINFRIFLYALSLTLCLGLISGVYPAWKMSRLHPVTALRGTMEGENR